MVAGAPGVLLDVDGTLVDTSYLHAVCWAEALAQSGHVLPMAAVHRCVGMGSDMLLDHLVGEDRDRSADQTLTDAHSALYRQWWGRLRPLPGARDLVRGLADRGLRVVLASSAQPDELAELQRVLDAGDAVAAATSSGDAETSKPAPDLVQAALERGGVDPERTCFVGDSVWDVEAAARAGIPCIGVTCGGTSDAELTGAGAVEVHDDPEHLLENLGSSVLLKRAGLA
ncbi:MAG: HAD family hydrolase [Motilibacteraceae bacterium]